MGAIERRERDHRRRRSELIFRTTSSPEQREECGGDLVTREAVDDVGSRRLQSLVTWGRFTNILANVLTSLDWNWIGSRGSKSGADVIVMDRVRDRVRILYN